MVAGRPNTPPIKYKGPLISVLKTSDVIAE